MQDIWSRIPFFRGKIGSFDLGFLTVLLGFFLLILVLVKPKEILSSSLRNSTVTDNDTTSGNVGTCYTKSCNETAASFLRNMDPDADPCDNFYKYACGNYLKTAVIPEGKSLVGAYLDLMSNVPKQLNQSLSADNVVDKKPYRLAKTFYKSCMNNESIEAIGTEIVVTKMKEIGGWPVLDGDLWNETAFDWIHTIFKLQQTGFPVNHLIDLKSTVRVDSKGARKHMLVLDKPSFSFPYRDFLFGVSDESLSEDLKLMVHIAESFGANESYATNDMSEVLDFELKLQTIWTTERAHDNLMTISQLNQKFPYIPWLEFINAQLPVPLTVQEDEMVIIKNPEFFAPLASLLKQTPKRTLANYLMWRVAHYSIPFLNEAIRNYEFTYKPKTTEELPERWQDCVAATMNHLLTATEFIYVREHFDRETKNIVLDMITNFNDTFADILRTTDWMDGITRKHALSKLAAISYRVAYPEKLLDDQKLDQYYKEIQLSESTYFENVLKLNNFQKHKSFENFRKLTTQDDHSQELSEVLFGNIYYSAITHSIHVPAVLLQDNYFHKDRPKYVSYGKLGPSISRGIAHNFFPSNVQLSRGDFKWYSDQTKQRYMLRTKCVIRQYSNYSTVGGLKINGKATQAGNNEEIAAMKIAYNAYKQWVKKNSEEQKLPGIDRSPNQLFWLSAAHIYCTKYRRNHLVDIIEWGNETPMEFRIVGSLTNLPEFAEDYNCPRGSKMNPVNRCSLL